MTPTREEFVARIKAEQENRAREKASKRKAAELMVRWYYNETRYRTVRQRKEWKKSLC